MGAEGADTIFEESSSSASKTEAGLFLGSFAAGRFMTGTEKMMFGTSVSMYSVEPGKRAMQKPDGDGIM